MAPAIIVKWIKATENSQDLYQKIRADFGKNFFGILKFLLIPQDGQWSRITEPQEIKNLIIKCNTNHFHQASIILFRSPQVQAIKGWYGNNNVCKDLSQYNNPIRSSNLQMDTMCILCNWKRPRQAPDIASLYYTPIQSGFQSLDKSKMPPTCKTWRLIQCLWTQTIRLQTCQVMPWYYLSKSTYSQHHTCVSHSVSSFWQWFNVMLQPTSSKLLCTYLP